MEEPDDDDDDTAERQAAVGTLFALDSPDMEGVAWSIHRYRSREEIARDPNGKPEEWVADMEGPLKGSDIVMAIGGGTFHFYGHVPKASGGVKLAHNRILTLAGPRRDFSLPVGNGAAPAPAAAVALAPAVPDTTQQLLREMIDIQRRNDDRFIALLTTLATREPPAAPAPQPSRETKLTDVIAAVAQMKQMTGGDGNGSMDVVKSVFDAFRQGLELGQEREPLPANGGDPNPAGPWIERGLSLVEAMIRRSQMPQPRPRPPGAPGAAPGASPAAGAAPGPPPASEATVVDERPAVPHEHRWATAVETLYRGMLNGRMPDDIAASIADMLDDTEVAQLKGSPGEEPTADQVLTYLAPLVAQYPQLTTEQGKVYVGSVLASLRTLDEPEA